MSESCLSHLREKFVVSTPTFPIMNVDRCRTRSSLPRTDLLKCIICQAEKRDKTNMRLLERTYRCTWSCTRGTLINAARVRRDERILLEVEQADLHAKDVIYHPSCYKDYTSQRALELLLKKERAPDLRINFCAEAYARSCISKVGCLC